MSMGFRAIFFPWDFIYSNGGEGVSKTDTGIDVNLNDPKITEALEYYQTVFKNHNRVFPPAEVEGIGFAEGNLAMLVYEYWIANSAFAHGKMADDYGYLPFPICLLTKTLKIQFLLE